jgi:O-antigen ligase
VDLVEPNARDNKLERWWAVGIGLFASFMLVVGPLQIFVPKIDEVLSTSALFLIAFSVWRLRTGLPSSLALSGVVLLGFGLVLLGAQLIPLPISVWTSFPGRQVVLETFAAAKVEIGPMPLSLDPVVGRSIVLYIMPSVALFFASLSVKPECRKNLVFVIVVVTVLCAFLGLVQRFQGSESTFFLNNNPIGDSSAKGTFLNRNFFAAQLYCTVPLVAAVGVAILSGRSSNRFVLALMLFIYFIAMMAALGATGSRGGLGLAMLAVLLSSGLVWSGRDEAASAGNARRFVLPMVLIGLLLIAQFGLVGLLRIAQTDTINDQRATMTATTLEAIRAYFPFGSGFGSFVPVYKLFERPEDLLPTFVNNAHNDWLELALEGGLPMILLMVGFFVWYLVASFKVWRTGTKALEDLLLRAATLIILLLLLHSLFDYPLRTRALIGLFAICCGFLAFGVRSKPAKIKKRKNDSDGPLFQTGFQPARTTPFFVKRDKGALL